MDPVIADLNRYLDEEEAAELEYEAAERELYRDRFNWAIKILADDRLDLDRKARIIVSQIETEVEEALDNV